MRILLGIGVMTLLQPDRQSVFRTVAESLLSNRIVNIKTEFTLASADRMNFGRIVWSNFFQSPIDDGVKGVGNPRLGALPPNPFLQLIRSPLLIRRV